MSELLAFDAEVTAYKEDRLPLSDYVVALAPKPGALDRRGSFYKPWPLKKVWISRKSIRTERS